MVLVPLLAGCFTYRAVPQNELAPREYVKVVADSGFVMHAQTYNHTERMLPTCRLTSAEGTLLRISADTVWLSPIAFARPAANESADCRNLKTAFTVRSAGTAVHINANRFDRAQSRNAMVWGTVIGAVLYWYISELMKPDVYGGFPQ